MSDKRTQKVSYYIISGFISALSSLILLPLITKYYSPEQFSYYAKNIAFQAFMVPILSFQAPVMITRYYHDKKFSSKDVTKFIFTINFVASICIGVLGIFVIELMDFSIFVLCWSVTYSLAITCKALERIKGNAWQYFLLSVLEFTFIIGISLYVILREYRIDYLFIANAIGSLAIYMRYVPNVDFKLIFRKKYKPVLFYGISFLPYSYSNIVSQYFERIIVPVNSIFGIYYFFEKFNSFLKLLINKVNDYISPKFVQENINSTENEYKHGYEYKLLRFLVVIGFIVSGYLYELFPYLFDTKYLGPDGLIFFEAIFIFSYLRVAYLDRANAYFIDKTGGKISLITGLGSAIFLLLLFAFPLQPINVIIVRAISLIAVLAMLGLFHKKDKRYKLLFLDMCIILIIMYIILW